MFYTLTCILRVTVSFKSWIRKCKEQIFPSIVVTETLQQMTSRGLTTPYPPWNYRYKSGLSYPQILPCQYYALIRYCSESYGRLGPGSPDLEPHALPFCNCIHGLYGLLKSEKGWKVKWNTLNGCWYVFRYILY